MGEILTLHMIFPMKESGLTLYSTLFLFNKYAFLQAIFQNIFEEKLFLGSSRWKYLSKNQKSLRKLLL